MVTHEEDTIHVPGEVIPPGAESSASETEVDAEAGGKAALRTALVLAVVADVLQLALFPLFAPGGMSPVNDALDVLVGLMMVRLLGWHWVFLPSFLGELVPVVDELPCWTLAVLYVKAKRTALQSE